VGNRMLKRREFIFASRDDGFSLRPATSPKGLVFAGGRGLGITSLVVIFRISVTQNFEDFRFREAKVNSLSVNNCYPLFSM
jgi:hypothetical protein